MTFLDVNTTPYLSTTRHTCVFEDRTIVALCVYAQRNTKCLFGCLYLIDLHSTLCTYLLYVTRNEKSSTMSPVYNVITALHR